MYLEIYTSNGRRITKTNTTKLKQDLEDPNGPKIGDTVRIINPRPGQENCGIVEGFYKGRNFKIRTAQGGLTRRLPNNIRYIV